MKTLLLTPRLLGLTFCIFYGSLTAQPTPIYASLTRTADSLLTLNQYLPAARKYTEAFRSFGWRGFSPDRYSAGRAWALAGVADSAFFQLERIITKAGFDDFNTLERDIAFMALRSDPRWPAAVAGARQNSGLDERFFDPHLFHWIDSLEKEDQKWRTLSTQLKNAPVQDSVQLAEVRGMIQLTDSLNYYALRQIMHTYGYPNADKVANEGAHNFWLLVQHQDMHPAFQDSVLQLMEKEVAAKKASGIDYAYLLDRVSLNTGKLQVYGTQMTLNASGTSYEPRPVIDPERLNERRTGVGLGSIESYIETMNQRYFGTLKKQ